ncbi:MAG: 50S ribosomal protein L10 [Methanosarcinales archaeon Met12]|nr:MAG: 50S ribosomal protein L10 [Methanosarcinales archaeon Met12]
MAEVHSTHIPKWKKDEIEEIKESINSHPAVGIVNVHGIPARQLQQIRAELYGSAILKIARNTLIERALDESDEKVRVLKEFIEGQTALLFTELNPFKLQRLIEKNKSSAPAKPGDIAPCDIIIEKGPTPFKPGPIVGEFQNVGVPAAIEGGKVVIRERKVLVKAGDKIQQQVADILTKLEIYPMEVGLNLRAVYEEGMIFRPDILAVDESKYFSDFMTAVRNAFNLSINIAYPTSASIRVLLQKASVEARSLAINAMIFEPDVIDALLAKANLQMVSLTAKLSEKALESKSERASEEAGEVKEGEEIYKRA